MPPDSSKTVIEILDRNLNKVAEVKNPYPINQQGMILRYSKELSDYGDCRFRISTKDPVWSQLGDIIEPHVNHLRIRRGGSVVWSGAIVDNPARNKNYIEVLGHEYDFYLDKVLIRRDAEVTPGDGKNNYRIFKSGTMAAAVQDLITKAKEDFTTAHPLGNLTVNSGNIENPDYPTNFTNENGQALTGGWTFTDFISLQFDYHTVYYVLKAFGAYAACDFEIDADLNFYFKKFIGNKQSNVVFQYSTQGNVVDYDAPRLGKRMINDYWGIAADTQGKVLHANQRDTESYNRYGLLQGPAAYTDVKDQNMLKTRMNEELQFLKSPDDSPINVLLNEKAYPLGQYDIGDIVSVKIKDNIIDYNKPRRIVGITVNLHNTGREMVTVQTNKPKDSDIGA